ncbi:hypothetical protein FB451DRAFT_1554370 [Mycena latifolia]|nr:hypothetical protein FB451DRAFT_1554370 [Mycena latifolia]
MNPREILAVDPVDVKSLSDAKKPVAAGLVQTISAVPSKLTTNTAFPVTAFGLHRAAGPRDLDALQLAHVDIGKWLRESLEHSSSVREILSITNTRRSLPTGATGTETAAVETIALRLPFVFDFHPLFKLDAGSPPRSTSSPSSASSSPTGSRNSKHWGQATSVPSKNIVTSSHLNAADDAIAELESAHPERKIHLLTLASLGFKSIGHGLPYAQAAEALQLEPSELEKWVVDRYGLTLYLPASAESFLARKSDICAAIRDTFADVAGLAYYALDGADPKADVFSMAHISVSPPF